MRFVRGVPGMETVNDDRWSSTAGAANEGVMESAIAATCSWKEGPGNGACTAQWFNHCGCNLADALALIKSIIIRA